MKGRTPKAEGLKRLQGNTRRQKKPGEKVFFQPAAPADPWVAPDWLADGARAVWAREIEAVRRETKLQASALPVFAAYCDAVHRLQKFSAAVEGKEVYTTPSGYQRKSPYVELRDAAANAVRQLAAELNLTPKSWISSMGTYSGRQLDLFVHGGQRPAPQEAEPAHVESSSSFFAAPPTLN